MTNLKKDSNDVKQNSRRISAGQKAMEFLPIPFTMFSLSGIWLTNPKKDAKTLIYKLKVILLFTYVINTLLQMTSMVVDLVNNNFSVDDFGIYTCSFNCLIKAIIIAIKSTSLTTILLMAYDKKWTIPRDSEEKKIIDGGDQQCR